MLIDVLLALPFHGQVIVARGGQSARLHRHLRLVHG
jgi:hypothetical protein